MRTVAILPVKRFSRAKQRLREALDDEPRARLAAAMAADVLEVLCAFDDFTRVIVVTAEPAVTREANACGAHVVEDRDEAGQSAAAALRGLPVVRDGDDLGTLTLALGTELRDGDVRAAAHKVVSKAEGRVVALAAVSPDRRALALATEHGKDPRVVQVVLDETTEIV